MQHQIREWITYRLTAADAADLAGMGETSEGYARLRDGLQRCQALHASGHEWAAELVALYRRSLERYAARYGDA